MKTNSNSVVRKMTEEEKAKMEMWSKKAVEDERNRVSSAAVYRRALNRKNWQDTSF